MSRSCCSAHRCSSITCEACCWRYSLVVTRRIVARELNRLHVVTIAGAASSPHEFGRWRKSVHNSVAYRRCQSRWWRSLGIWGWWNGTNLRGVVSLGSVTTTEFMVALRRHGQVHLRPIEIENIRTEVYAAAMLISAVAGIDAAGRYQSRKIAVEPVTVAARTVLTIDTPLVEPLPIIF